MGVTVAVTVGVGVAVGVGGRSRAVGEGRCVDGARVGMDVARGRRARETGRAEAAAWTAAGAAGALACPVPIVAGP